MTSQYYPGDFLHHQDQVINTELRPIISFQIYSYLSHGDSYSSIATRFRLGPSTVYGIVPQTCEAIWEVLHLIVLKEPDNTTWVNIECGFYKRWDFPNAIDAIDGKHINIQAPPDSASLFHNYKGFFSLVLLALVDHQYKFTFIDVGEYGSNSDSSIFRSSHFGTRFLQGDLDVPAPKPLPNFPNQGALPHCIVGDEAFPLCMDLMRPYPRSNRATLPQEELVFNYRLSRARRIVENAFGMLAQRFRIFNRRMQLSEHNGEVIIKTACALHNFLTEDMPVAAINARLNPDQEPYLGRDGAMQPINNLHGYHSAQDALQVRDIYKRYFNCRAGSIW